MGAGFGAEADPGVGAGACIGAGDGEGVPQVGAPLVPVKYCIRFPAGSKQVAVATLLFGPPLIEDPVRRPSASY